MNISDIIQAISTVGFPIMSACFCYWYIATSNDKRIIETRELTKIISDNTIAIQKLCDRIEEMEKTYEYINRHIETDIKN